MNEEVDDDEHTNQAVTLKGRNWDYSINVVCCAFIVVAENYCKKE
jgi:hypothetical protein